MRMRHPGCTARNDHGQMCECGAWLMLLGERGARKRQPTPVHKGKDCPHSKAEEGRSANSLVLLVPQRESREAANHGPPADHLPLPS